MHTCETCGYKTRRLDSFKRHLNRKNPCKDVNPIEGNVNPGVNPVKPDLQDDSIAKVTSKYSCDKCCKIFTTRQAKSRHKKNVKCKPPPEVCQPIAEVEQRQIRELQEEILMLKTRKKGFTEGVKKRVASGQGWKCNMCDCNLPHNYQVDHIQAVCLGGQNDISNAQALCKPCHQMKTKLDRLKLKSRKLTVNNRSCSN